MDNMEFHKIVSMDLLYEIRRIFINSEIRTYFEWFDFNSHSARTQD